MQGDSLTHNERLQNVGFELLNQQNNTEHNQRLHRAQSNQRQQHSHSTGNESTNHRNEGAEEDQHTQRDSQRHAQNCGTNANADSVNSRHQNLNAHVRAQGLPTRTTRTVDGGTRILREEAGDEQPDTLALHQEEDQGKQGQQGAGCNLSRSRTHLRHTVQHGAGVIGCSTLHLFQQLVQLVCTELVTEVLQPTNQLLVALHRLIRHGHKTAQNLLTGQRNNTGEHQNHTDFGNSRRATGTNALLTQKHHGGAQQSRQQQSHQKRNNQQGDVPQALPKDPTGTGNHNDAPRPSTSNFHSKRHPVAALLLGYMFFCNRCNFHGVSKSLSVSRPRGAASAAPAEAVCGDVVAPLPCASIHRGSKAAKAAAPSRYRRLKVSFSRC